MSYMVKQQEEIVRQYLDTRYYLQELEQVTKMKLTLFLMN